MRFGSPHTSHRSTQRVLPKSHIRQLALQLSALGFQWTCQSQVALAYFAFYTRPKPKHTRRCT